MPSVKNNLETNDADLTKSSDISSQTEKLWENVAKELDWHTPWHKVVDWHYPYARWFVGGQCNIVANALDRHLLTEKVNSIALIWEGQDGKVRSYSYQQLSDAVCQCANALKSLGLKKGDTVSIYLPRIPEQYIAMLACAKIGLVHSVVFSGFSAGALRDRVQDARASVLITCDGYLYRDKYIPAKHHADQAMTNTPTVKKCLVVRHGREDISMQKDRDIWWDEIVDKQSSECKTEIMDANDPLFILYTSGSTGRPKGVVHGHGGYMVGVYYTSKMVFGFKPDDIYFCTADAGWITGHSYIVYGPLINGTTVFVYEGPPDYPDPGKWWSLIEKHKVTILYTAPTAIRALMKHGDSWPQKYNLSTLRLLGSVGEPLNPAAWEWYHQNVGNNCPIVDTWWQTETGMHMISSLSTDLQKPGSAGKPIPGISAEIVDDEGVSVPVDTQGNLVIQTPWPAMLLDIYQDSARYRKAYWSKIPGVYVTGDSAIKDKDGYFWIIGRNDDVMNVSGHRFGSAELESACVAHVSVAEAAAIGIPHDLTGEAIKLYIILKNTHTPSDQLRDDIIQHIRIHIGTFATPHEIAFVSQLPKTRSGKIMRRILKAQSLGQPVGDVSTLEN